MNPDETGTLKRFGYGRVADRHVVTAHVVNEHVVNGHVATEQPLKTTWGAFIEEQLNVKCDLATRIAAPRGHKIGHRIANVCVCRRGAMSTHHAAQTPNNTQLQRIGQT